MNVKVSISEAPTTGLGRLITDNRFFVPTHQRDYKWDRERVEKFFDDLTESMERGDKFYFIGLMVFMGSADGRLRVLDGQQRLATTIIVYSALRSWFGSSGDNDMMSRIQYDFIGRAEYGDPSSEPKLTLNRNNDDKFQTYVTEGTSLDSIKADLKGTGKNTSNYSLLDAIIYCHQRIAEKAGSFSKHKVANKYLSDLIKFMRDSVIVVRLTVPNEANAFRVFETLNDRGMDLSAVDLLKNYLFGCVHHDAPRQTSAHGAQMESADCHAAEPSARGFSQGLLDITARIGAADDIFDEVKKECKTGRQAEALSRDLLEAADHYAALDEPEDVVWSHFSPRCRQLVRNLRVLGSKLVRPVILSALKKMDRREFEKLLWILEVIIVRWQLIGEGRTGTIERQCARLAQQIWNGKVLNRAASIDALKDLYLEDAEFAEKFSTQSGLTNQKAAHLLRGIEDFERSRRGKQTGKELTADQGLTLEHVLPLNPSADWTTTLRDDPTFVEDCSTRLGNLCLLPESRNRDVGDSGFAKKKKIYASSELITTQEVAKHADWTREAVDHHQRWLASKAALLWRL